MKRSINPATGLPFNKPQTQEDRLILRAENRARKRSQKNSSTRKNTHGRKGA